MRRHVVRALLLASLTGCDAQAVKALLATNPAVDGKASDATATDANKSPATPADIVANLLARLAAVDVAAKVGKVARPSGNVVQAPTVGGSGSNLTQEGAPLQPGADGSFLTGDPTRLPQPGFAPMPLPEGDARPPIASMPAPPQVEDGWQGMHLDFGSKDFAEASLIARKLASVLEDAKPFAVSGQVEPAPVWSFAFANAKGGFAQIVVTPEGADLSYVAEQSGVGMPPEAAIDLDAVKIGPVEAVAALRARLAEGSLQDIPFSDDLAPVGLGKPVMGSGTIGSESADGSVTSSPVATARRVQSESLVGTVGSGSTMPAEPIAMPGRPLPDASGSEPPSVSLPPMPQLPKPVETVLREMPAATSWHATLRKSMSGQLIWLVNAHPDRGAESVVSPGSPDAYPVTKEAVYRRVQDLAADGGEASSETPVPIEAVAPDGSEGYVGMPAPDDAEGSVPVYPVRDVPMALPTMTSPSVGYPGSGSVVTGWEVRKFSYFLPLAAALDAVSGKVLAVMLPRQVTYFYPEAVYGPPCDACVPVEPMPTDPGADDPGEPGDPVIEEPPAEDPVTEEPPAEDPVTEEPHPPEHVDPVVEEPPTGEPLVEQPAEPDAGEPAPDGTEAGAEAGPDSES